MENKKELTMSDFMFKKIRRKGEIAELIFDELEGKPVRLMGFQTEASKDDFTIREEAYFYFLDLIIDSKKLQK